MGIHGRYEIRPLDSLAALNRLLSLEWERKDFLALGQCLVKENYMNCNVVVGFMKK